jgi:hypothetical protein
MTSLKIAVTLAAALLLAQPAAAVSFNVNRSELQTLVGGSRDLAYHCNPATGAKCPSGSRQSPNTPPRPQNPQKGRGRPPARH